MTDMKNRIMTAMILMACAGPANGPAQADGPTFGHVPAPGAAVDARLGQVVARDGIVTAGAGVLQGGKLVWAGYYGVEAPGVPAGPDTRFNVASITKTVAAETVLRLVDRGRLPLDEPMAPFWVDPDVAADRRHLKLTPRMVLTHTSGFPNWRFFRRDGKLVFEHDPGERYGYSGEGFQYLAHYAETRLGQPFPALVQAMVFGPLGMKSAAVDVRRDRVAHMARPVDAHGNFPGWYCRDQPKGWCRDEGSWSAAGDMVVSVPDYAKFLAAVWRGDGYGAPMKAERDRIQADRGDDRLVRCDEPGGTPCPDAQGYGLGFNVLKYGDVTLVGHGGYDWAQLTVAYVYEPTGDGLILFLNAPVRRALDAMPDMLAALDANSPFLQEYNRMRAHARAKDRKQEAGP
ncbi:MAG: class A beta-lactamase-related serine hydrolase [Alphaproteobacteria bacterium]|nr:MAG: class A beta-lactamase-related serine hydrolase [Alphaproteobacteria bacterium]